jgi:hypothetical protein
VNAVDKIIKGDPVSLVEVGPAEDLDAFAARTTAENFKSKFGGRFIHEFTGIKPSRDWLLKGAMTARSLYLVIGAPGCGKSFLTLDFVLERALAAVDDRHARMWFGHRLKPGGTAYIAGEGQDDFIVRMHAWLRAKGLPPDFKLPMFLIPTAIDMRSSDAQTKDLIEEIKAVGIMASAQFDCAMDLAVVDTVNKALAGGDDTKPEHVGSLLKNCELLKISCQMGVIGIHHTPKAAGRIDPRGHSSLIGDNDGQWFIKEASDGAPNEWRITRLKAGPIGARHEFRLRQVKLGQDDDGDEITSCVVVPCAAEGSEQEIEMREVALAEATRKPQMTPDGRSILGDNLTIIFRALHEAIEACGTEPDYGVPAPHGRKVTNFKTWLDFIVKGAPGDEKDGDKFRDKCRKARDAAAMKLRNRGIIGMDGDNIWRTSKRVAMVDRPASQERREMDQSAGAKDGSQDGGFAF